MTTQSLSSPSLPKVRGAQPASLPLTRTLTLAYALSFLIALLMAVTSAAGILYQDRLYPAGEALYSFVATDLLNLVVALPLLLVSLWLARRGKLLGLLCWPGSLLYVLFVYVTYALGLPFGLLFLPYLLLVTLSAYTTIGLVASVDAGAVRRRLVGAVPERLAGGILAGLALLYGLNAIGQIITALLNQAPTGPAETAHWMADLAVMCPAWIAGGLLLWRRRALGYVAVAGLLLLGSLLFIGTIPILGVQAYHTASPLDVGALVQMLFMGLVCFVPLGLTVRGIVRSAHGRSSAR